MAYLGRQPAIGRYTKLDDFSSSFNGSLTTFDLTSGGDAQMCGSEAQIIVSLGGIIQEPETDYTVAGTQITFTTAPLSGDDFFAILLGDTLDVGVPSDDVIRNRHVKSDAAIAMSKLDGSSGSLTALTVDDITINGSTISDSGELTIDVGGDIILDADGGDIIFKDGGTTIGTFANNSNNLRIVSNVSDADLILRGVDGGAAINALTLDMSDAGTAKFNHDIKLENDGAVLSFGNDQDVTATHVTDVGIDFASTRSGADSIFRFKNSANASASDIRLILQTGGTSGGDPLINLDGQATNASWSVGVDTSATKFVIADADKGGFDGSDEVFTIATGGSTTINGSDSATNMMLSSGGVYRLGFYNSSSLQRISTYGSPTTSLTFAIQESEKMRVANSGNVGIGTTSPDEKLEVWGNAKIGDTSTAYLYLGDDLSTGVAKLEIGTGRSGSGYSYIDLVGDTTYSDYGLRIIRNNSGANAPTTINHRGTGTFTIKSTEAADILFQTTNEDRMTIDSGGNVGIGTTSPSAFLHVIASNNSRAFHSASTQTTVDSTQYHNVIDHNTTFSGSATPTADRLSYGWFLDSDFSGTFGGTTTSTERFYNRAGYIHSSASHSTGVLYENDGLLVQTLDQGTGSATVDRLYGILNYTYDYNDGAKTNQYAAINGSFKRAESTGTTTTLTGSANYAYTYASAGPVTYAYGSQGYVQKYDSSTTGTAAGVRGYITGDAGTITNGYGGIFQNYYTGTMTNGYGVYTTGFAREHFGGSVGIGTTAPGTGFQLEVKADDTTTGGQVFINQAGTGDPGLRFSTAATSYMIGIDNSDSDTFKIDFGTTGVGAQTGISLNTSGLIGFGTGSPTEELHIFATAPTIRLEDSQNNLSGFINGDNGNVLLQTHNVNRDIIIGENAAGAELYRFLGLGRFGIATSAPSTSLHVKNGFMRVQAGNQESGDFTQAVGIDWSQESDSQVGKIQMVRTAWSNAPHKMEFYVRNTSSSVHNALTLGELGQVGIGGANYGTDGQVLTSQGASLPPQWEAAGGGAWTLIGTQTASSSASLTQTGIDATYATYCIIIEDFHPSADSATLMFRLGDSSGIDSTSGDYDCIFDAGVENDAFGADNSRTYNFEHADSGIKAISGMIGSATGEGCSVVAYLHNARGTSMYPTLTGRGYHVNMNGNGETVEFFGHRTSMITTDRILVEFEGSTTAVTGRMTVWGIAHA